MPTFYRIVQTDPPTEADFLSYRAQGRRLVRDTPELRRSWEGVSVYDSFGRARSVALRYPRIGTFIAELEIAEDGPVRYAQTLSDPRHFDLWGEPGDMLATVRRTRPVGRG
jgi:hypothetical protein